MNIKKLVSVMLAAVTLFSTFGFSFSSSAETAATENGFTAVKKCANTHLNTPAPQS